jgi:hypothetical protein
VTRICAGLAAIVLVVSAASASAKRGPVLAFVWNGSVVSLMRVDPMSLRSTGGPTRAIGTGAFLVARSPRGATLAFDTDRGAILSLVDSADLEARGRVDLGEGWIASAAWTSPTRLVAVVGSEVRTRIVTVDPATHRKLTDRALPLRETLLGSSAAEGRVVFLVGRSDSIGPVRLGVAGADGRVRTVVLARITGGTEVPADHATGVIKGAWPGLAAAPDGRRAAVVGAGGLVAEVDLDSLAVSYHTRTVRTPARAHKALAGWQRSALWLPTGVVAITGRDYSASVANGTEEMSGTPAGVTLVDSRDWTSKGVDEGASLITRIGSTLVAFGGAYASGPNAGTGIGVRGYSPDGALLFQLFGTDQILDVQAAGGLVYVTGCDSRCFRIVDPASGAMVGTAQTLRPTQLVGA